jgi:hypothetical protein
LLQDARLANTTAASLRAAISPKATAARSLAARFVAGAPLGSLQLFSSIAGLLGSAGQANYAAANAALDAAAAGWQQRGMPAASVAWGAWGGAGMAAADAAVAAHLRRLGIAAIPAAHGLAALEAAVVLAAGSGGGGPLMAAALAWERLLVAGRQRKPFYAEMAAVAAAAPGQEEASAAADAAADGSVAVWLAHGNGKLERQPAAKVQKPQAAAAPRPAWAALAPDGRVAYFGERVAALVAHSLGRAAAPDEPLMAAGLNSLGGWSVWVGMAGWACLCHARLGRDAHRRQALLAACTAAHTHASWQHAVPLACVWAAVGLGLAADLPALLVLTISAKVPPSPTPPTHTTHPPPTFMQVRRRCGVRCRR